MARDSEGNYGISEKQVFVINNNVILLDTPSLGSIYPNLSGELLSFSRERRMGRRSQGASESMDYTVIEGFNTAFLNQLTKDQRIRFAVGDQITEETYKVSEIRTDNVLVMEGNFTANDQTLISRGAEIQVIQSYRVGSWIPMFLKDNVEDTEFQSVVFYVDGELQGQPDTTWPFSSFFIPQREGNYTLAVVANSATNTRSLYTERIFVDKKDGNIPDGSTLLQPTLTRPGSTTIGSELIFSASYDDLDEDGISRVEFYLNGNCNILIVRNRFILSFVRN